MSSVPTQPEQQKKGLFLKYQDFKKLEKIIEEYNVDENNNVDFNSMTPDEKEVLWKIKTIIRNMESVRLRTNNEEGRQES